MDESNDAFHILFSFDHSSKTWSQKLLIDMTKTIMRGWVWRYGAHQEFPWLWGEFVWKVAGIIKNMSSFGLEISLKGFKNLAFTDACLCNLLCYGPGSSGNVYVSHSGLVLVEIVRRNVSKVFFLSTTSSN